MHAGREQPCTVEPVTTATIQHVFELTDAASATRTQQTRATMARVSAETGRSRQHGVPAGGDELEAVLTLAAEFPVRHHRDAPMPVFGRGVDTSEQVDDAQSTPLPGPDATVLVRAVLDLVRAASVCASLCEHVEHNEPAQINDVVVAAHA